jgi:hypothetical protein
MPPNRRNYYRLLHVQHDAPAEVVKAAYRALIAMHHPDKGGDHTEAAMVNEAYNVLSDTTRRAAYDAQRAAKQHARSTSSSRDTRREPTPEPTAAPNSATSSTTTSSTPRPGPAHRCPLCGLGTPAVINATSRCARCRSPLAPVLNAGKKGAVERRSMPRVSKSDWALMYVDWPSEVIDVRMRDISLDGLSVYSGAEIAVHRMIRVAGASFDVVAEIVSCRRVGKVFTLHGRLVTAYFSTPAGSFVSTSA